MDGPTDKQGTGTSCVQHSPNLSTSLFLAYDGNSSDVIGEPHWLLDLESYNSMSMSRESTSLKKS